MQYSIHQKLVIQLDIIILLGDNLLLQLILKNLNVLPKQNNICHQLD